MRNAPFGASQGNEAARDRPMIVLFAEQQRQIEAERQRLGITPTELERRRLASLKEPF